MRMVLRVLRFIIAVDLEFSGSYGQYTRSGLEGSELPLRLIIRVKRLSYIYRFSKNGLPSSRNKGLRAACKWRIGWLFGKETDPDIELSGDLTWSS